MILCSRWGWGSGNEPAPPNPMGSLRTLPFPSRHPPGFRKVKFPGRLRTSSMFLYHLSFIIFCMLQTGGGGCPGGHHRQVCPLPGPTCPLQRAKMPPHPTPGTIPLAWMSFKEKKKNKFNSSTRSPNPGRKMETGTPKPTTTTSPTPSPAGQSGPLSSEEEDGNRYGQNRHGQAQPHRRPHPGLAAIVLVPAKIGLIAAVGRG